MILYIGYKWTLSLAEKWKGFRNICQNLFILFLSFTLHAILALAYFSVAYPSLLECLGFSDDREGYKWILLSEFIALAVIITFSFLIGMTITCLYSHGEDRRPCLRF